MGPPRQPLQRSAGCQGQNPPPAGQLLNKQRRSPKPPQACRPQHQLPVSKLPSFLGIAAPCPERPELSDPSLHTQRRPKRSTRFLSTGPDFGAPPAARQRARPAPPESGS